MACGHLQVAPQTTLPEGRVAPRPWASDFVRWIPGASPDRGASFWTSRCKRQRGFLRYSVLENEEGGRKSHVYL